MAMIPLFRPIVSLNAGSVVSEVLTSGMIGEGPKVEEFTALLKKEFENDYITCLNSCTSALRLAYRLAGVKGGTVITPTFTFPATNTALLEELPANIVFYPVDKKTLTIDTCNPDFVRYMREHTVDAVIITLVGGVPPYNLQGLKELIEECGSKLIIDAAHAIFTTYKGKHISHYCHYCCLSFQSIKQLTTGDGGALICSSVEDYDRAQKLKWVGIDRTLPKGVSRLEHQMTYSIKEAGFKYHMNDINAAIGIANLPDAKQAVLMSRSNARLYTSLLRDIDGIALLSPPKNANPSWWVYGFWCEEPGRNMELIKHLELCGVQASPLWRSNHMHDFLFSAERLDDTQVENHTCFIPNGPWVSTDDVSFISDKIKDFMLAGK